MTPSERAGVGWIALALTVLGLALLMPRLGESALWDPWEPKYVQTAREMGERDAWVVPYYRHEPRLVKPPLTYWLIATAHAGLGETEFAARLPSALLALLAAVGLGCSFAARGRQLEGLLAGAALLTAPQWLLLGRSATPDMPLAAIGGLLLAAAIAFPALEGVARRLIGMAVPVLLAGAVLVEWPRGLLLPAWAVLGWGALRSGWPGVATLVVTGALYAVGQHTYTGWLSVASFAFAGVAAIGILNRVAQVSWKAILGGAVVVSAIAAPWFVLAFRAYPEETVHRLLGYKHGINLGEALGGHTGPLWYPLLIVAVGAFPWIGAAAVALPGIARRDGDGIASVVGGASIGVLLFYTLSEAKMGHFYGAIQPALAGLAAVGLTALVARRDRRILLAAVAVYLAGAFVAFDGSLLLEGANVFSDLDGYEPFVLAAGSAVAWLVLVTLGWVRGKVGWMLLSILPAVALAGGFATGVVPGLDAVKSHGPMWQRFVDERSPEDTLGTFGWAKDSIFYYSNNGVPRLHDGPELLEFLAGDGMRWVIVSREDLAFMRRSGPPFAAWEQVDESHPYHVLVRVPGVDQGRESGTGEKGRQEPNQAPESPDR
jgi:4-amino-4-deoxy-L-arabinose transferase-like glycosyltransferase